MSEFLLRISVFMLLGKTLLHFCPSKKYERYLKLLFGFMVMVQIMKPLFSFGGMTFEETYDKNLAEFEQMVNTSVLQADETWFIYESQIEQHIEKECEETELLVQDRLEEQVAEQASGQTESEQIHVEAIKVEVKMNE